MCGIFCYLGNHQNLEIKKSFNKIKHRGPDNSCLQKIDHITFGFHRLTINGLDEQSNQPLKLGKLVLICNGEIYNHKELEQKYGFDVKTGSDCEVILHMYHKFGIVRTVKELDAEFAFCLYDGNTRVLYVARDHLGIRPLFIGKNQAELAFASEAKALTEFCSHVRQFKPGCYLGSEKKEISYYSFEKFEVHGICRKPEELARPKILEKVRLLLTESVKDRLMSDQKIGCFLSGGLDSSLITSIASRFTQDLEVFTIGLANSSDIIASKKVSKFLELKNHHIVEYTVAEGILAIPEVIKTLESYDITTIRASVPQFLLSKYIREKTKVRVLLSGECIDEVCGYYYLSFIQDQKEFMAETRKMLKELHLFDLLRTDRTTMAHSLEVRVPFASKKFLNFIMNINPRHKMFGSGLETGLEKMIVRDAFKGYLPDEILYRRKHAFSDAVSSEKVSWYKSVEKYCDMLISDKEFEMRDSLYPVNTPVSKESFWYRKLFEKFYPGRVGLIDHFWMPNLEGIKDPSATVLEGFVESAVG